MAVLAEHHGGNAGCGRAGKGQLGRGDAREVPDDRNAELEMRIVSEQRLAGRAMPAIHHPFIGSAVADNR